MNDQSTPDAEAHGEERGQEPELSPDDGNTDLSDFMRSIRQTLWRAQSAAEPRSNRRELPQPTADAGRTMSRPGPAP